MFKKNKYTVDLYFIESWTHYSVINNIIIIIYHCYNLRIYR